MIIYEAENGKVSVVLYARDGNIWLSQNQIAELFGTSVPNISMHITNILKDNELNQKSVIKDYLTTAADGKKYSTQHSPARCGQLRFGRMRRENG